MKIISSYGEKQRREEEFKVLVDVVFGVKTREELTLFLECFLSESEKAYLGQRLDLMRMLAKNFNYQQIRQKITPSNSTINHAQQCLDLGGDQLKKVILSYKYKAEKPKNPNAGIKPLVSTRYKGAKPI